RRTAALAVAARRTFTRDRPRRGTSRWIARFQSALQRGCHRDRRHGGREGHAVDSTVTWADILLRLAAAVLAGAILGYDRGTRGHIAGLRTTILICLAAAGAMIEANLTLSVVGKSETSFTVMDALRFPLGILSGIGFIGAGAILKRGTMVEGVTTAATLWLVTVIGLILGGGYFLLGGATVVIAFIVLAVLVHVEPLMRREHRGSLTID